MKVRNGFVSNSSSSSFIISGKLEDLKEAKIETKIDLTKYGEVIKTVKDLDEHIVEQYGCRGDSIKDVLDDNYLKEKYAAAVAAIGRNEVVCWGSCSDDSGDPIENMLCMNGFDGLFGDKLKIIEGEGGY